MHLVNGPATVQNSQCQIIKSGSQAVTGTSAVILRLNFYFYGGYTGNRLIYVAGRDTNGGNNTGWQVMGTWTAQ
jgi:hypothetical protein